MATKNRTHRQNRVPRYVALLVLVNIFALGFGVSHVTSSSRVAYELGSTEKEISQLQYEIALMENQYHTVASVYDVQSSQSELVAFTPASQQLRYARVGGSVYSLLTN